MTTASAVLLVMSREVRQRLRSKGFAVTTVALCLAVLAAGVLHRALAGDDSPDQFDVAVIGEMPPGFVEAVDAASPPAGIEVHVVPAPASAAAEGLLDDGGIDVVIDTATGAQISEHNADDRLSSVLDTAWRVGEARQAAADAGLDDDQIAAVLSPSSLTVTVLSPETDDDTVALVVGSATAILLFISINAFGGMVLTGVVEEKTTGVVEVLLAHVKAYQLLTGKVLGIGTVAMIQFAAALAAAVVSLRISGVTVPAEVWFGLPATLLWFVVGFVLYSTLFALAGSFVSRQEDAQGAAAPISVVFTAAYLTVFVLGTSPGTTTARIVSVLPPFAPLLMPLRIATGAASVVEIVTAALLLVAATIAMLLVAGSVYSRALLHRGSRLGWREALRRPAG